MARQRATNEVVTHGGISGPLCGITGQTVEATSEQRYDRLEYLLFTDDCIAVVRSLLNAPCA